MLALPVVGNAVAIGVCRHSVVGGILYEAFTISLGVDDSLLGTIGGTAVEVHSRGCLLNDTLLYGVATVPAVRRTV